MYAVLDIGGTFVKYALMDEKGNIAEKGKRPASRENLEAFKEVLFSILDSQGATDITGIAISCPGTVDVQTGTVYHGGSFPFLHDVQLAGILEEKYGKDVCIENDAKCAALAELWLGSVKDAKDSVVLVLGSGVGGGIIIDKKLHRGINLSAGEVSYVMSGFDPVSKKARFVGYEGSAVEMVKRIGALKGLDDPADGEAVFALIHARDQEAMAVFDEYCLQVAGQILNLQYILDPELFAIGGGISAQPILLERIQWAVDELKKANPFHMAAPAIVACQLGNDANLYGALYHFLNSKKKQAAR